jgi:hypothetical protein
MQMDKKYLSPYPDKGVNGKEGAATDIEKLASHQNDSAREILNTE